MANKNEMVHLKISEAKEGKCELCKEEEALQNLWSHEGCEVYVCRYCGHKETFMPNGNRKEKPIFSRYL